MLYLSQFANHLCWISCFRKGFSKSTQSCSKCKVDHESCWLVMIFEEKSSQGKGGGELGWRVCFTLGVSTAVPHKSTLCCSLACSTIQSVVESCKYIWSCFHSVMLFTFSLEMALVSLEVFSDFVLLQESSSLIIGWGWRCGWIHRILFLLHSIK